MIHLTLHQLSAYLDDELVEASAEIVRRHLAECEECTLKFATLEEQDHELAMSLSGEPGHDFYDRLERTVDEAIPEEAARAEAGGKRATRSGRDAAEAGTKAPREERPAAEPVPARRMDDPKPDPQVRTHAARPRSAPVLPWIVAAALFLVIASLAIVAVRPGRPRPDPARKEAPSESTPDIVLERGETPREPHEPREHAEVPRPAPAPEPTPEPELLAAPGPASPPTVRPEQAPAPKPVPPVSQREEWQVADGPVKNLIPVVRTKTVVETLGVADRPLTAHPGGPGSRQGQDAPASTPAEHGAPKRDPFAGLVPELSASVRAAERKSEEATLDPSAAAFDGAAAEWDRALALLRGTPYEGAVRFRLAAARYGAWQASPNAYRAAASTAALRSCIVFAAPGPHREEAKRRLAEVKR